VYQFHQVGSVFSIGLIFKKISIIVAIIATFFTANFIIKKNGLSKDSAYMILFYLLLLLFFPSVMNNLDLIVSNFFIILALRRLVSLQSPKSPKEKIFDASLWIFMASLFHFWSILFIILVFISILFHTARDYRTWFLPFIAFFISIVIIILFDLVFHKNSISNLITNTSRDFEINYFINNYQNLAISLFTMISLYFTFYVVFTISNRPIILHSSYKKIVAAFFIGIAVFLISPNKSNDILIFTFAPLAFMITLFTETPQSKVKRELTIAIVILCSFFAFFSQL
jgi:MFS family permease